MTYNSSIYQWENEKFEYVIKDTSGKQFLSSASKQFKTEHDCISAIEVLKTKASNEELYLPYNFFNKIDLRRFTITKETGEPLAISKEFSSYAEREQMMKELAQSAMTIQTNPEFIRRWTPGRKVIRATRPDQVFYGNSRIFIYQTGSKEWCLDLCDTEFDPILSSYNSLPEYNLIILAAQRLRRAAENYNSNFWEEGVDTIDDTYFIFCMRDIQNRALLMSKPCKNQSDLSDLKFQIIEAAAWAKIIRKEDGIEIPIR